MKITAKEISKRLTNILNLSLSSGIIPKKSKVALVQRQFLEGMHKTSLRTTDQYQF